MAGDLHLNRGVDIIVDTRWYNGFEIIRYIDWYGHDFGPGLRGTCLMNDLDDDTHQWVRKAIERAVALSMRSYPCTLSWEQALMAVQLWEVAFTHRLMKAAVINQMATAGGVL